MTVANRLSTIVRLLRSIYGLNRHGNVRDGFWELVYILFSIRTGRRSYQAVYRSFKRRFIDLRGVAAAPVGSIERELKPLGLSRLRARQLSTIARAILRDYGAGGFNRFGKLDHEALEQYLLGFHGIGVKVAKCVSMYAFEAPSLPVDTHVWRVMSRLGYAPGGRLTESKGLALEAAVPPRLRYPIHVLAISHGREVCTRIPSCDICVISRYCPSAELFLGEEVK